uniref:Uncharacterized protein n=1 Tax=Mycena chlorophos TaxID=658473 RepID=A0ABQ0MAJ4_MYCCL|nr:predicted protein [Mycena chlorophos]
MLDDDVSSRATLIACVVGETILFAVFFGLFAVDVYLRITRYRGHSWSLPLALVFSALFSTCAAHFTVTVAFFIQAQRRDYAPGFTSPLSTLSEALIVASVLIADSIVLNRLRVVWPHRLVMVFPTAVWLAMVANGICRITFLYRTGKDLQIGMLLGWVMNAVIIFYCTTFIGARLLFWSPVKSRGARRIAAILVESAVLMSAWAVFYGVTERAGWKIREVAANYMPQIVGIADMLIYVRIGLSRARAEATQCHATGAACDGTIVMTSPESIAEGDWSEIEQELKEEEESEGCTKA